MGGSHRAMVIKQSAHRLSLPIRVPVSCFLGDDNPRDGGLDPGLGLLLMIDS